MKLGAVMGLISLALTVVLIATFMTEERPSVATTDENGNPTTAYLGHGQPHPELETLLIGGSGAERVEPIFGLAVAFGVLQIAFFLCCMLLGVRRQGVIGPVGKLISVGAVVYALAFAGLMLAYQGYLEADALQLFGSFPIPTAWMIYGMGTAPVFFLLIFWFGFREIIWNDDTEAAFEQILADKRAAEGTD